MKMKVLQLVTTYQSVVTILYDKLNLLNKDPDINVEIASSFEDDTEKRIPPVKHCTISISRKIDVIKDAVAVVNLYKYVKKEQYTIIHTHTAKAGVVGAVAGFLAGIPVIHTYHGLPFYANQNRITYACYYGIEIVLSFLRATILSQNRSDYELLKKNKLINHKVILEGNGVDIDSLEKSAETLYDDPEQFIDKKHCLIVCVARFEPVKKIETIISAVEWLLHEKKRVKCIIAGKGGMEAQLKKIISDKQLGKHIRLIYTPNIHFLIKRADVFVLASEKEGIPRSVMEAMALKKPVVATDVLGTNELVVHDKTGLLVPLGDQNAMNRALMKILDNEDLRYQYGTMGRERIEKNFSEKKVVDLWIKLYRDIIKI